MVMFEIVGRYSSMLLNYSGTALLNSVQAPLGTLRYQLHRQASPDYQGTPLYVCCLCSLKVKTVVQVPFSWPT